MPIELTTGQWTNLIGAVVGPAAAVVVFRRGQRWAALLCGLVGLRCLIMLIISLADANRALRPIVALPFFIAILLMGGHIREEARRSKAERAAANREPSR